ncbi:hypothetical protein [Methylobacterium dankookense]|uniref:HTH HARE-type domain-containing protein n=1 Tax=Methylobacterium dankookense TaxID=560405 RepID=A0A564FW23_9HYPH|nr:hypothetical protein [Methylobacterium dankookense]GJD57719.1 hypothetical protein IFDJLNFL_3631 [Methylobacterium dankookense]VUF12349.1 hypothetical protein MTDSW087_02039 [Methylobacterium dankookense]
MVPSETEIEARLAELRRRREAIDREIADHLLYLELGRRLRAGQSMGEAADPPADRPVDRPTDPWASPASEPAAPPPPGPRTWSAPAAQPQAEARGETHPRASAPAPAPDRTPWPTPGAASGTALPPAVPFEEDPAAARRYGRALVEAALAVLTEANRPMHAGEILEQLAGRGFAVPGQDPVAALNTRLWKRSGPGGPLRRLGDAVYDRADGPGSAPSFGLPDLR